MISLSTEKVLSLANAAARLPRRRGRKKTHVATLYRWANTGLRGVRLETIRIGNTTCTSVEALQRFCDRLSEVNSLTPPKTTRTDAVAVERELEKRGYVSKPR